MRDRGRRGWVLLAYVGLAAAIVLPGAIAVDGAGAPGHPRSDLWNSLWSFWMVAEALRAGELPWHTAWLNAPDGGTLLVADLPGAFLGAPLVWALGPGRAWAALALARVAASGVVAHVFAADWLRACGLDPRGAWVAGVAYATAPVLLCGLVNGTSEAVSGAGAALAVYGVWAAGARARVPAWAWFGPLLALLGSAYAAVVGAVGGAVLVVAAADGAARGRRARVLVGGLLLAAPLAWALHAASTAPDNLVGIKHAAELAAVRRSTGAADPRVFVLGGGFRSPDFASMSRYGEGFLHAPYLGWVLLLGAAAALRGPRVAGRGAWVAFAAVCVALAMGPVVVADGSAFVFADRRVIPMPYFLVERLPGFAQLSLVWRLAMGASLGLGLLAAAAAARAGPRVVGGLVCAIVLETATLSPVRVPWSALPADPALEALRAAPPGAVMNFPVVGGRAYLAEQITHRKPIAGTLNFPNNRAGKKAWDLLIRASGEGPEAVRRAAARAARHGGVRYLVVHPDPLALPDAHDPAVAAVEAALSPLAATPGGLRVYRLW